MTQSPRTTAGLASKKDSDGILKLNLIEYGPKDGLANQNDFTWLHTDNPAGYAIGFALKRKSGLVIRPEFGVLNYSNGRQIYQFGIGFSPGIGSSRNEVPRDNNPF